MAKRVNPQTSFDAYHGLDPNKLSETFVAIVESLKIIKEGNYQDIAEHSGMPEARIWKRISDLLKPEYNLIHDTGKTKKTTHGNKSRIYALGPSVAEVEHKKRVLKGKTVADFSRALNQPKPNKSVTKSLF